MSADNTEQEFHLTPNGWLKGSFSVYGKKTEDVPIPADRIQSGIEEIDDTSGWAPPAVFWKVTWTSDSITPEELAELQEKFQRPAHVPWKKFKKKKKKLADYY
jgi:hypothetical protein